MSIVNIKEGCFEGGRPYRLGYDTEVDRYVITVQVVGEHSVKAIERQTVKQSFQCPERFVEVLKEYISAPTGFQLQFRRDVRIIDSSLAYEFYEIRLVKL